jgi:hypothetical protein
VIQGDALDLIGERALPASVLALLEAPDGALPFEESQPAASAAAADRLVPALIEGRKRGSQGGSRRSRRRPGVTWPWN